MLKDTLGLIVLLSWLAYFHSASAQTQKPDEFFEGKAINLYIGTTAGGTYDLYGRLVARYIGSHIPGRPSLVVQNMPGAASLRLANFLFNNAPRDGTALGVINQAMPIEQFIQTEGIRYKADEFTWIGRATSAVETLLVWHSVPVKSVYDIFDREVVMGGSGPTSSTVFIPKLLNNLGGTKFKVVPGYSGMPEAGLAMERGEVEGMGVPLQSLKSNRAEWVKQGKIKIIVQLTPKRHPELKDVPTMVELGKTEDGRKILNLHASASEIGRSIVAPPEMAPERVRILRRAFDSAIQDPLLVAEAAKQNMDLEPMTGEDLQAFVKDLMAFPAHLVPVARSARE